MPTAYQPLSCSACLPGMGDHSGMSTPAISGKLQLEDRDRNEYQPYTALIIIINPCHVWNNKPFESGGALPGWMDTASSRLGFLVVMVRLLHLHWVHLPRLLLEVITIPVNGSVNDSGGDMAYPRLADGSPSRISHSYRPALVCVIYNDNSNHFLWYHPHFSGHTLRIK